MQTRNKSSNNFLNLFGYLTVFLALYMGYRKYPIKTACDFLDSLDTTLSPGKSYWENNASLLEQHSLCLADNSTEAVLIKRKHNHRALNELITAMEQCVYISIAGGSGVTQCDPEFANAIRMGYVFENLGICVAQGGGAGVMHALLIGSDLFCRTLEELEQVIELLCEAKTASSERQAEIKSIVKSYATCEPQYSLSAHGAFWLGRMPALPDIGFGAWRAEIYSVYTVLEFMEAFPDIWINFIKGSGPGSHFEHSAQVLQLKYKKYLSLYHDQLRVDFDALYCNATNMPVEQEDIKYAGTVNQTVGHATKFLAEKTCVKKSSLQGCAAVLYQQANNGFNSAMGSNNLIHATTAKL